MARIAPVPVHFESPIADAGARKSARIVSVDALRGFDMLWIIGGSEVVEQWAKISNARPIQLMASQLEHRQWEGFTCYDFIFPLFVFLAGISIVFALSKRLQTGSRGAVIRHVIFRGILLFLFGIFYNGGLSKHYADVRIMGVLQRIALAYVAASIMFCFMNKRMMVAAALIIVLGYWSLLNFATPPGASGPTYAEGANWANYVDAHYLPLRKHDGNHDPEGLLSTLPAIVTCLLGVFAGLLLRATKPSPIAKVFWLFFAGAILLAIGFFWGGVPTPAIQNVISQSYSLPGRFQCPIIKKIWTSSYVLVAGGYSAVLLGLFYLVIDVLNFKRLATPFIWIGMNAITLYLLRNLFRFTTVAERLVGGDFKQNVLKTYGDVTIAALALLLVLLLARFLHKRQIFLRL